jgi:hypothetical protein
MDRPVSTWPLWMAMGVIALLIMMMIIVYITNS